MAFWMSFRGNIAQRLHPVHIGSSNVLIPSLIFVFTAGHSLCLSGMPENVRNSMLILCLHFLLHNRSPVRDYQTEPHCE